MKIIKGDLWRYWDKDIKSGSGENYIVITTNMFIKKDGSAVLGRGVASQALKKVWLLDEIYGEVLRNHMSLLEQKVKSGAPFYIGYYVFHEFNFIMFPVKYQWFDKAEIGVVKRSLRLLRAFLKINPDTKVYMPIPAIGFGELEKPVIMSMLEKYLGEFDNLTVVERSAGVKTKYKDSFKSAIREDKS